MRTHRLCLCLVAACLVAAVIFLRPPTLQVTVTTEWVPNGTLAQVEASAVNALIRMWGVSVHESGGTEVRITAQRSGDIYSVAISSELFEPEVFRVPASYPELAADIVEAHVRALFPLRSGEWRVGRLRALDELVDVLPAIERLDDLPSQLATLRSLRGAGIAALTAESDLAGYLYGSTGDETYLTQSWSAYAEATRLSLDDPRVLACGVRVARLQGRMVTADTLRSHPGPVSAMLRGDYGLANRLGHRWGDLRVARRSFELDGASSWQLIADLEPTPEARFLKGQWHLFFGDPVTGLSIIRKVAKETGLAHHRAWVPAAMSAAGHYQDAVYEYGALADRRCSTWHAEALYWYAHSIRDPARQQKALARADQMFHRASRGGDYAELARAWLGDQSALDDLTEPETIHDRWVEWMIKRLLNKPAGNERRKLSAAGLQSNWFRAPLRG